MTTLIDGPDRWIYPVEVTASNDEFVVHEDQDDDGTLEVSEPVSLPSGDLWGHDETAANSGTGLPGLYDAVTTAMNNASSLSNTYQISHQTPTNSSVTNSGITIFTTDTSTFEIEFGGAGQIPPQWLGWAPGDTATGTSSSGPFGPTVNSPYSARSYWQPWPIFADKTAASKDYNETAQIETSSSDEAQNFQVQHGGTRRRRAYQYPWLGAAHVRGGKATDSNHASNAGLPTGDTNNAFYHLWDAARQKKEIIVVHNEGDQNLFVSPHNWERGYLTPASARSNFEGLINRKRDKGEFYTVDFQHEILESEMAVK